jgi:hypothetical protein
LYKYILKFTKFFSKSNNGRISIDKLIISSEFSSLGFSKRIVRKLQHLPNVQSIQVWSLWHAEKFYKQMGFHDIYPSTKIIGQIGPKRRIEGEWGPLLMWTKDSKVIRQRDSMVSILGF